jgi:putative endonuclease
VRAKDALGAYGERVAVRRLEDAGYTVLDRNWRCRRGELDVVAARGGVVVFAEVKCRRSATFGPPAAGVTPEKAARLRALASLWLDAHDMTHLPVRFDVIAVSRPLRGPAVVEHLEGAF